MKEIRALPLHFILWLAGLLIFQGCASSPERSYRVQGKIRKTIEVPMVSIKGLVLIQAQVDEAGAAWFLLDTGAEMDLVNRQIANRLSLKKVKTIHLNQTVPADWCEGIDLKIGKAGYHPSRIAVTAALDEIEELTGHQIDGVLGHGFFRCFVVEYDYVRKVLRLHNPRRFRREDDFVPIHFVDYRPLVDAAVDPGSVPEMQGRFFLDTGATLQVLLTEDFCRRHQFDETTRKVSLVEGTMVHRTVRTRLFSGEKLRIGAAVVTRPGIEIVRTENPGDGIIGSGFLQNFRVTFDYTGKKLWLDSPADLKK